MLALISNILRRIADAVLPVDLRQNSQLIQRSLYFQYRNSYSNGAALPGFQDAGFRVFSQSDEDGLLLYIFSLIGFKNRLVLDIASGTPVGGNTTNLIVNWGCHALLIEGSDKLVKESVSFYQRHIDTKMFTPNVRQAWVTAENINQLVTEGGLSGEIELFSLDVDGVDYWLWERLDVVSPRVVMVEYQDMFSSDEAVTVPYSPVFDRFSIHPEFFGASLAAFTKLAHKKGYRLIGCNRYGYNAFFLRNDIAADIFPEVSVSSCLMSHRIVATQKERRINVAGLPWQYL